MEKLIADLTSWYWWVSVVLIGILVNLASSYAKPWIDRYLMNRSEQAQKKRAAVTAAFETEVSRLSGDTTLLLISGQRLQNAQVAVLSVSTLLAFFLALGFFLGSSPVTAVVKQFLGILLMPTTVLFMILLFVFMRRESELEDTVRAARKRYESSLH